MASDPLFRKIVFYLNDTSTAVVRKGRLDATSWSAAPMWYAGH